MNLRISKRSIFLGVAVLVLGLWVAGSIIIGMEYFNLKKKVDSNDAKAVVSQLSKLMEVPNEDPTVATITDAVKLKEQEPFYKNAQNGDKVIIWKDKALIYRVETNKIIDFGVVIRSQQNKGQQLENQQNTQTTPQQAITPANEEVNPPQPQREQPGSVAGAESEVTDSPAPQIQQ